MTTNKLLLPFLCACCVLLFASQAASQPDCATVEYIEDLNRNVIDKRIAHIKGKNARVFIALDPIWSAPEFDDVPYRHEEDMKMINKNFKHLMEQDINEVIVWNFRLPGGLAAAVPFKDNCAVSGYGEPDHLEKLIIMHETLLLISEYGADDQSVRDGIEKLLMVSRYARFTPHDDKIDKIINKIRPLMTNMKSPSGNPKHESDQISR